MSVGGHTMNNLLYCILYSVNITDTVCADFVYISCCYCTQHSCNSTTLCWFMVDLVINQVNTIIFLWGGGLSDAKGMLGHNCIIVVTCLT